MYIDIGTELGQLILVHVQVLQFPLFTEKPL